MQGQPRIPYLAQQGTATQLMVADKPFLMLGGELGNSTASALAELDNVFAKLRQINLNTVLTPAYWELIEPEEGKFDFTSIDAAINAARNHNLKIVFLWFGSWKNSMSCYAPAWVKENYKKYPRAVTEAGKPLEIMSAFNRNNLEADKRAFVQLMKHIATTDKEQQTVIMVQVENEIGMLGNAREYTPEANKLFKADVPKPLIDYLLKNKKTLRPQLFKQWETNGFKTKGNWTSIFGEGLETEEFFMAWHYGLYVQEIAQAGKQVYPLPMYLNAALNSRGRKAGQYPSAGPLAHLLDIWRAAAPAIDFLSPDIYDPGFEDWLAQYHIDGNPLFVPEIRFHNANAIRALYAFGEHDAMGFSPFSIEDVAEPEKYPLTHSYNMLQQLSPLLAKIQGKGQTNGIILTGETKEKVVNRGNYTFTFTHFFSLPWENNKDVSTWNETGAILIQLSEKEFIVAGSGVVVTFGNTRKDGTITGISSIDEVELQDGKMRSLRRLNGDQDHQGRHLRIPVDGWSIQHVKLYDYK
ncbi:beta-galactosidase [Bacteroidia bacterium]|nr:beta-galactosidase [Bacteroidia bacterium]